MGANTSGLDKLADNLRQLTKEDKETYYEACAKELAARLLAKVVKRTPVGVYPSGTGKLGGTLRRGWTSGQNMNASAYANSLNVKKTGHTYSIELVNPVEYASYVEYGHRTANHAGWVEGKFMLTISEQELQGIAPRVLEARLKKMIGDAFR